MAPPTASSVVDKIGTYGRCMELKTKSYFIGYINLVFVALMIIKSVCVVYWLAVEMQAPHDTSSGIFRQFLDGFKFAAIRVALTTWSILLGLFFLALVFAIILLIGLHKNKPRYLRLYLISSVILLLSFGVLYGIYAAAMKAVYTILSALAVLLECYFLLVIRSMHLQMVVSTAPVPYSPFGTTPLVPGPGYILKLHPEPLEDEQQRPLD